MLWDRKCSVKCKRSFKYHYPVTDNNRKCSFLGLVGFVVWGVFICLGFVVHLFVCLFWVCGFGFVWVFVGWLVGWGGGEFFPKTVVQAWKVRWKVSDAGNTTIHLVLSDTSSCNGCFKVTPFFWKFQMKEKYLCISYHIFSVKPLCWGGQQNLPYI